MKKDKFQLTTAQFAQLHEVNRRTLHYYDTIGLFSPRTKGENKYRYYDTLQSMDFEYIRMLKELNMSIEEIRTYLQNPNATDFIKIADQKMCEIDSQIEKLRKTKSVLKAKKEQLCVCNDFIEDKIEIIDLPEKTYLVVPFDFKEENLKNLFSYVKNSWGIEQCRMGIGSYISIEKAEKGNFEQYDGLFTPALRANNEGTTLVRKKGKYLCGYQRGTWDKIPAMYEKMFAYAKEKKLNLTGYAFETGMNDFAISDSEEYITQIIIKIEGDFL